MCTEATSAHGPGETGGLGQKCPTIGTKVSG